jgi:multicomponent Na+:H+ antiporter subunit E
VLNHNKASRVKGRPHYKEIFLKTVLFGVLWWSLVESTFSSWLIGIIVVPFATWLSFTLYRGNNQKVENTANFSFVGLLKFLPFFAWQSLRGGCQTASLALSSRIAPAGFIEFETFLGSRREKILFMHIISLMPGSVTANINGQIIRIHILDINEYSEDGLRDCEQRLSSIFVKYDAPDTTGAEK